MTRCIREATQGDWPGIWPFLREIVRAADAFPYDPELTEDQARALWMVGSPGRTTVAVDGDEVAGRRTCTQTAPVPGACGQRELHVVGRTRQRRGPGAGRGGAVMGSRGGFQSDAVQRGRRDEHAGDHALAVPRVLIVGTVPEAFHHPEHGHVGLHVMHLSFDE